MAENALETPDKIAWEVSISDREIFYPSLAKKIEHSAPIFEEHFEIKINKLVLEDFDNIFLPLYKAQIAERADYHLDYDDVVGRLKEHMAGGRVYEFFAVYEKSSGQFVGGSVYSLRESGPSIALRVFDREFNKKYKARTTIDFWAESCMINSFKERAFKIFKHGADSHPRYDGFGLPLFKLQVGARAKIAKKSTEKISVDQGDLGEHKSVFFFSNPDENEVYGSAHLVYDPLKLEAEQIVFLEKVLEWAEIKLTLHAVKASPHVEN